MLDYQYFMQRHVPDKFFVYRFFGSDIMRGSSGLLMELWRVQRHAVRAVPVVRFAIVVQRRIRVLVGHHECVYRLSSLM